MIAFLQANAAYALKPALVRTEARLHVFAGGKENAGVLRSAELLSREIPGSSLTILPGLYHGEFSLNRPRDYARTVRTLLAQES